MLLAEFMLAEQFRWKGVLGVLSRKIGENGLCAWWKAKIFLNLVKNLPTKILDIFPYLQYFLTFNRPYVVGI